MSITIDYEKWRKIALRTELIVCVLVCITELANNILLYVTGGQGYTSENVTEKFLRYFVLTSLINFGIYFISRYLIKKRENDMIFQRYVLIISMILILTDVSFSHYQFSICFGAYAVPILLSIMYEDLKLLNGATILSILCMSFGLVARGFDSLYNAYIIPEAIIAYTLVVAFAIFARLCITTLIDRRIELARIETLQEREHGIELVRAERDKLKVLNKEVILSIARMVDYNDPYTAGHSERVGKYAARIAKRLSMPPKSCEEIYYAGLLHDVGKIGIDNSIINKTGKLTDEEYAEIKRHPVMGYEILKDISVHGNYALGAKYHHERMDGRGYPEGIVGEDIPLIGRIIAVADSYDAMTSKRPYRDIMPQEAVRTELENGRGTQFDSRIVDIMLEMMDEDRDYRMHQ